MNTTNTHDAGIVSPVTLRMMEGDRASGALGMIVREGSPGRGVVTMEVRSDMLNGFDVIHGGLTFALADTAFAVACNETEQVTLGAGAEISYLRPARLGQVLTATAERRALAGRSGIYDVSVTDEEGNIIAEFRGRSRVTGLTPPAR